MKRQGKIRKRNLIQVLICLQVPTVGIIRAKKSPKVEIALKILSRKIAKYLGKDSAREKRELVIKPVLIFL